MGIVHRLARRARALVARDLRPVGKAAQRGQSARVHVHVLIILPAPSLSPETQAQFTIKQSTDFDTKETWLIKCSDLHRSAGKEEAGGPWRGS